MKNRKILLWGYVFLLWSFIFLVFCSRARAEQVRPYVALRSGIVWDNYQVDGITQDSVSEQSYLPPYLGSDPGLDNDNGMINLAFGVSWRGWSWEAEYEYEHMLLEHDWEADLHRHTLLFNGYYSLQSFLQKALSATKGKWADRVDPYLGAGLGYSWLKYHLSKGLYGQSVKGGWSFAGIVGVKYWVLDNLALDLRYKYREFKQIESRDGSFELDQDGHSILFGVEYHF